MTKPLTDTNDFALYFDPELRKATPYSAKGAYFAKAKDRMDRTFDLLSSLVQGKTVVDVGASPFYLLHRCKQAGAARAHGIYFCNDDHPLKGHDQIYSGAGPIELSYANVEVSGFSFPDDSVDILTACEILEHFDHFPTSFAKEVRRVLKPGGYLTITVPNVNSIANILKLLAGRNIYYPYRTDHTGRHKHEYTMPQLKAFIEYLGLDIVKADYMPSPTSDKFALRPLYRLLAKLPGLKNYSPVLYILAQQRSSKATNDLDLPPKALFDDALSIEE